MVFGEPARAWTNRPHASGGAAKPWSRQGVRLHRPRDPAAPTAVFEGLRRDEDEEPKGVGWRCYCGVPDCSYRRDGTETAPYPNRVYLVFVNDEGVAYNWRWEKADTDKAKLPVDHLTRFKRQLL